eukprot:CFRG4245T1
MFRLCRTAQHVSISACAMRCVTQRTPSLTTLTSTQAPAVASFRGISSTTPLKGIEEFYDTTQVYEISPTGRAWEASELRNKSYEDLHKLWYVLLKERNLLMTMMHDARSNGRSFPSPKRLKQVKLSMNRIKVVCGERERAVKDINRVTTQTQQKKAAINQARVARIEKSLHEKATANLKKLGILTKHGYVNPDAPKTEDNITHDDTPLEHTNDTGKTVDDSETMASNNEPAPKN